KDGPFLSRDDFKDRTKVAQTTIDTMTRLGLLEGLPESNQISLFDFMSASKNMVEISKEKMYNVFRILGS
ncbi:MAG: hypothetical protein J6X14_04970, partial [Lachnospiraceae bacterium]|nr:hypothetical protein [Lachnospiraceae bacterium]